MAYVIDCIMLAILSQIMIYFIFRLGAVELKKSNHLLIFY